MKKDLIPFLSIYAVAFAIVLWYGLAHQPVNDGVVEYQNYIANIEEGWKFRYSLVNSCLITTLLPVALQKIGVDTMFAFRIIPALFYPLMPAFTYLIARRYVDYKRAILASLVVLCSSYFIFFPDMGRVGVSIAFMSGMIWALLENRFWWALSFAVLIVFSHYATSFIAIGTVFMACAVYLVWKRKLLLKYAVVCGVLIVLTGVWHYGIAGYSGKIMSQTIIHTEKVGEILPVNPDIMDVETREPAVQEALLTNVSDMSVPKKIEIASNYAMVIMVSFGLLLALRRKDIDLQYKIMSASLYGLIIATVAIPWLSVYYGGMRVYFTSTMLLGVCYPIATEKVSKIIRIPMIIISLIILIMYALSTSGLIYEPFGLEKTFPVVVSLE